MSIQNVYEYAYQSNVFVVGKKYKITFTIVDWKSGNIRVRPLGQSPYQSFSGDGTYTFFTTATNTSLAIERETACDLYIEKISVKEVTYGI